MLTERLLQFIWQFQYYNFKALHTTAGEPLTIIKQGQFNTNQGPDFLQAQIKIGETLWAGNIELHLNASDWLVHKHDMDTNYNNVILHVVWKNDAAIKDSAGNFLYALEMQPLVSNLMLKYYDQLMQAQGFVPCENHLPILTDIGWLSWKERLLAERLQKRANIIFQHLYKSNKHWEEVLWWMMAKNFGATTNTESFEQMARSISINILAKHKSQLHQLEALLFGQAGLLSGDFTESYPIMLQREYQYLKQKHSLVTAITKPAFLRMRPANFPTVRLAQLAMLISQSEHLFSKIKEAKKLAEITLLLNVTANDYWHYHYNFDEENEFKPKVLGEQMINNIIINTVIPIVFAYGLYTKQQEYKDKAVDWLASLAPEQNNITKQWKKLGIENNNALHSQALLELKKHYCDERKCLDCAAGAKLLKA